jgi:nucleotide-binding universal stress UspA family protein
MFKHILIPVDGSPVALQSAKAGVRYAAESGARVTAVHAVDTSESIYTSAYAADARTFVNFEKRARQAGEELVAEVGKLAKAAGVPFASLVSEARTPYEGIVEAATKKKCDLIWIASHGRRGAARLILGSVAQKVLAHAGVPVLVYRRPARSTD